MKVFLKTCQQPLEVPMDKIAQTPIYISTRRENDYRYMGRLYFWQKTGLSIAWTPLHPVFFSLFWGHKSR
jgi:hypothetical protein